ncbi:rifin [Plasmodium falciparum NF54]|uniref:Rifin n=2 Tax=Plasmodium falciparum TaxID=5833 RepID=A0A143ZWJ4_PLAF7|nr:rifin [Plasmodium falciparum 3D7]KAF4330388.1 rifin [Plasmodium falciparum NF54]PKC46199.1 rifin [Plasmodium falciparum NF54]CZT62774.1 rifin [Plasmodium falciparum 3D7]|eukprot:XP_002808731.1 rifin [Plasmodium falciparum 3D7]
MKIHYTNILLFPLKLNILVNTQQIPSITPHHTPTIRLLCECELYVPNCDNDPEMKRVMQQFHDRTTQRFQEYDERLQERRQICKDKCDKEIQKIILKDKLEKELMDKFATLDTDIQSDAIPTCICEKSLADKVERGCLRCGYGLGSVAPMIGLTGSVAVNVWKTAELAAAMELAKQAGAAAGIKAGHLAGTKVVIDQLHTLGIYFVGNKQLETIIDVTNYMNVSVINDNVYSHYITSCTPSVVNGRPVGTFKFSGPVCNLVQPNHQGIWDRSLAQAIIKKKVEEAVAEGTQAAETEAARVTATKTAAFEAKNIAEVEAATTSYYTPIIASIVAIVIIVLIMVIIYKILRYRRKKKMKKKLQYIKLLEE